MGESLQPPHQTPACILYSIFTLIDDLLIRPLRLRLTGSDSIGAFVRARVVLSPPGGVCDDAPVSFKDAASFNKHAPSLCMDAPSSFTDAPSSLQDARTSFKDARTSFKDARTVFQRESRRDEPRREPLATLEHFLSAYAIYCLETDVEPLLADEVVKAIKAPGIGLAVHRCTTRQVGPGHAGA
jgi:uncharacterized DUF497 family protein